jgi:hypothetical protein
MSDRLQQWRETRARAERLLRELRGFDPDEPRDDQGRWTGDGGGGDGGGKEPSGAGGGKPAGKGKVKAASDFVKDKVELDSDTINNKDKEKKFIERWNEKIGEAPAEFRQSFLGGANGNMRIRYDDGSDQIQFNGSLMDENDRNIGTYTREIDFRNNKAHSSYFSLRSGETGAGVGKAVLRGNVAMYQKLGLDKVEVYANIDVGGYAWAKYGYVPTAGAWASLSRELRSDLKDADGGGRSSSGNTYTPESWDELGSAEQERIQEAWARDTREEFIDSEVENWRESGQALDDAKGELADNYPEIKNWAQAALTTWRDGREEDGAPPVPFSNEQILEAISVDYKRDGEGRNDLDVTFDDKTLDAMTPAGHDPAQQTLPGIEPIEPHELLNDDVRSEIEKALSNKFDSEAQDKAGDMDPPDYVSENVGEYQNDYWDSMSERDRFRWAQNNNELPEIDIEDEDEPAHELPLEGTTENTALMKLASSSDPKAIWKIADSPGGKDLLLGKNWNGVLDLHDKQSMDRFNAYVGRGK